jgi:PAS domain S-box-containing protein
MNMDINILVVEDSAPDRLMISSILKDYNVLMARDGKEALEILDKHEDISLLVLDLNMPVMNGFEVLETLKSHKKHKNLRTIILTVFDEAENEIKGLKLGAVDYIRKPIHKETFKARIDIHIDLLRYQRALEAKFEEQKNTLDMIIRQAPIGILISYSDEMYHSNGNTVIQVNSVLEQIVGRTEEEIASLGCENLTHPEDREREKKYFEKLYSGAIKKFTMEKRMIKPDGSVVWVDMIAAALNVSGNKKYNHICLVQDITERKNMEKALRESERSKSVLLSHLSGLAYRCKYDRDWTMQYVSSGCYGLTGYPAESLLYNRDITYNDIIAPEYRDLLWDLWQQLIPERKLFKYEYEIITADGERKWVLEAGQGIYNDKGEVEALEGIILDISDRKKIENDLRYVNEHDGLTGLYNRRVLENILKKDAVALSDRKRAVISVNLSTVQSLTRSYGFHYTQDIIEKAARELEKLCSETRLLFISYWDRFVFYMREYNDKKEIIDFCADIKETLDALLRTERIDYGIGVVQIDSMHHFDIDELLKKLLIASEKSLNSDQPELTPCFYGKEIEMEILREEEIKRELANIANNDDEGDCHLYLQYQPIMDLKSDRISGFEALARLKCSQLGLVSPLEFIPLAEETKLIVPIGWKIMRKALLFLKRIESMGYEGISVSVNVSVIQLLKNDFVEKLFGLINELQVSPKHIGIEITESVFSDNYNEVNQIINQLRDAGLYVAIDDFGKGYSSLARERELNVDYLKIDKHFIDKLIKAYPENAITSDIISMAHKLGHFTIAEGVEDERQIQYLKKWNCDKIQGFFIGVPLDEELAIEFLVRTYKSD